MSGLKQQSRIMDAVLAGQLANWRGGYNHGDGLRPTEHARAHRAAMTPERRAELDKEYLA